MSKKFLTAVDLVQNELLNARVQNLGAAPTSPAPVKGQVYFNNTDNVLYWYDGGQWIAAKAAAGATPSDTVSTQAIGDTSVGGASTNFSRGDHKHAMPAFGTVVGETTFGGASGSGAATTIAKSDHVHGNPVHDGSAHSSIPLSSLSAPFGSVTGQNTFGAASSNGGSTSASRTDHAHGTPVHDAPAHAVFSLSTFGVPTAPMSMGGQRLTSLGTPSSGTDAVTKDYADNMQAGLSWKGSCRLGTTANDTLSGLAARDGVTPIANDRVLVKNQSAPAANGIYLAQSGAWTRALDADTASEIEMATVFVEEGTTLQDTAWTMTTNAPITLGTTGLTWVQFGAGTAYTAGTGLTLSGSTFNVGAGSGITANADDVAVNFAGTGSAVTAAKSDHTHASGPAWKFAANVGGSTAQVINHALNTRDVLVGLFRNTTPWDTVECDVERTDANNVTLRFATAPSAAEYRVVVVGEP